MAIQLKRDSAADWTTNNPTMVAGRVGIDETNRRLKVGDGSTAFDSLREMATTVRYHAWSFDPKAVCDGAVDRLFLMTVGDQYPRGFVATAWKLSFEADPTTEVDLDLKRADAFIGVANSAVMDVLDTTAGASSESTAANINSGAAVANGKVMYLEFGTAYTEANHQCIFELWGYAL
jgi:hypothetical protein